MTSISLHLDLSLNSKIFSFQLGKPVSVSRPILIDKHTHAFNLPDVLSRPFKYENIFIGDVLQGGSCNVDILSFCPHNLTHVETSDHILNQKSAYASINKVPVNHLQGLVYVIDLTKKLNPDTKLIQLKHIEDELAKISYPITAIALKTFASELSPEYDFTGKNFLALSKEVSEYISHCSFASQKITTLLLDLPSTDQENDGGKLLAHRAFFEIPDKGFEFLDTKKKVIAELTYLNEIKQNYYYFIMTPAKIQTNAIITDILFYPLFERTQ